MLDPGLIKNRCGVYCYRLIFPHPSASTALLVRLASHLAQKIALKRENCGSMLSNLAGSCSTNYWH